MIKTSFATLALMVFILGLALWATAKNQVHAGQPVPATPPAAAEATETAPPPATTEEISLWSTIKDGGRIGYLIILMSMFSIALVIEHLVTIRRTRLVPAGLAEELEGLLRQKQYDEAVKLCNKDGSFLAIVVQAGLSQVGGMFGFFDMQSAMQEVSERQISKLYRKLEYLSFIAATAPMLGLLGTVTGMITAFNKIAATQGSANPSQLAGGISQALVTTCMGLVVAIPAMFFVSFFRNRIDEFVAETESIVEKLMGRFRKSE